MFFLQGEAIKGKCCDGTIDGVYDAEEETVIFRTPKTIRQVAIFVKQENECQAYPIGIFDCCIPSQDNKYYTIYKKVLLLVMR